MRRQPYLDPRRVWRAAFGIGTSEVEHVLATQTLPQIRPKPCRSRVDGDLPAGSTAKDIILAIIGEIGTGGGIGSIIDIAARPSGRFQWRAG